MCNAAHQSVAYCMHWQFNLDDIVTESSEPCSVFNNEFLMLLLIVKRYSTGGSSINNRFVCINVLHSGARSCTYVADITGRCCLRSSDTCHLGSALPWLTVVCGSWTAHLKQTVCHHVTVSSTLNTFRNRLKTYLVVESFISRPY